MLGAIDWTKVLLGIIAAVPLTVAAFASWSNRRVLKDVRQHQNEAAIRNDTGNEKPIGYTVHDIAQTVELNAAMIHTNTAEVIGLHGKVDRAIEYGREGLEVAKDVKSQLAEHLEAVGPDVAELAKWVRGESKKRGGKT